MYADVKIGDKGIPMLANAATTIYYKQIFHEDLFVKMQKIMKAAEDTGDASEIVPKLAFIMASQAEKADMLHKSFTDFIAWLEQFEAFDLETAAPEIMNVYTANKYAGSKPKNA